MLFRRLGCCERGLFECESMLVIGYIDKLLKTGCADLLVERLVEALRLVCGGL